MSLVATGRGSSNRDAAAAAAAANLATGPSQQHHRTPHPHDAEQDASGELTATGPSLLNTQSALGRYPGGEPIPVTRGRTFSLIHLSNADADAAAAAEAAAAASLVATGPGRAGLTQTSGQSQQPAHPHNGSMLATAAAAASAAVAAAASAVGLHHDATGANGATPSLPEAQHLQEFARANAAAIELTWNNISVVTNSGEKNLLQSQSGTVHGRFLAIMGPSGSGKTTLMNVLACRVNNVKVNDGGAMMINGVPYSSSEIKKVSGYVMQDDLLNGFLTVQETLQYAAELRLPRSMSADDKRQRVNEVIGELGLSHVRDVIVGSAERKGISGGERKRLCVAVELLSRPRLLFLDEPTSGLDSVTSLSLCETLKSLAESGDCTIVCTIHQPQSKIFGLFDDLLLLKSGRIIYSGAAADVPQYFAEAGFPCPPMTNIADHIMDVIQPKMSGHADMHSYSVAVDELIKKGKEMKQQQQQQQRLMHSASHDGTSSNLAAVASDSSPKGAVRAGTNAQLHAPLVFQERSSWTHQFRVLLHRSVKEVFRNRIVLLTQLVQTTIMAVLIGTVFLKIGTGVSSVTRRQPVLFFCVINQGVFGALAVINSFPAERILVLRERAAGMYYVSAYFLAKQFADMILQVATPIIFTITVYFIIGLQAEAGNFFVFGLFMILTSLSATSLALAVSALARTTSFSVVILPLVLEINRLFGGFFLSPANLPNYFQWLDALSFVKYAYVGISLNELQGLQLSCLGQTGCTPPATTISTLGLDKFTIGECVGSLIAYTMGMRIIAYLAVRYIKW